MEKICAICGKTFGCGINEESCWCEAMVLPNVTPKEIEAYGDDCFCENCLLMLKRRFENNSKSDA